MNENIFEEIKHINEYGNEFRSAREFYKVLEYTEYGKFLPAINRAKEACENSGEDINEHFAHVSEPQKSRNQYGEVDGQTLENIYLSRFACYLIIQNADPRKEIVALGQRYFAIQTRKQEINEQILEDKRRQQLRGEMKKHNIQLADAAKDAGVVEPREYAVFTNFGYMGLYAGLDAKGIHKKKGLKKSQKILDHMGSEELAANLFRATQVEAKLKREKISGKDKANKAHKEVGEEVRATIKKIGGTMPENLPATDNIKKAEKRIKNNEETKELGESKESLKND